IILTVMSIRNVSNVPACTVVGSCPTTFATPAARRTMPDCKFIAFGIRSPLLADFQRLLYSDSARAKLPSTVIYSAPVRIVDHCLRPILAPHADACRDLVIVTVGNHDCDRAPEIPGQIILDVVRPAIADADGSWIDRLRLAIGHQKEQDRQTVRNE